MEKAYGQITALNMEGMNREPVIVYKWERIESREDRGSTTITGFTRDKAEAESKAQGKY